MKLRKGGIRKRMRKKKHNKNGRRKKKKKVNGKEETEEKEEEAHILTKEPGQAADAGDVLGQEMISMPSMEPGAEALA